jgi:hypothetical protein
MRFALFAALIGGTLWWWTSGRLPTRAAVVLLALLTVSDLWVIDRKFFHTVDGPDVLFAEDDVVAFLRSQPGHDRVWTFPFPQPWRAGGANGGNYLMLFGVDQAGGEHPNPLERWVSYLGAGQTTYTDWHNFVSEPAVVTTPQGQAIAFRSAPGFLDAANVRYVISMAPLADPALREVYRGSALVYENTRALPRAYLVPRAQPVPGEELAAMTGGNWDPRQVAFVPADELRAGPRRGDDPGESRRAPRPGRQLLRGLAGERGRPRRADRPDRRDLPWRAGAGRLAHRDLPVRAGAALPRAGDLAGDAGAARRRRAPRRAAPALAGGRHRDRMSDLPLWRRILTPALVTAAFAFLAWTAFHSWRDLRAYHWDVEPGRFALSLVANVGVLVWGVFVWSRVLAVFADVRPRLPELARIWFLSSAARYVPGNVWQFVAAAQLAREAGLAAGVLLTSLLIHTGFSLLSAGVVAAVILPAATFGRASVPGWWAGLVALAAVAVVHPAVLRTALRVVPRRLLGGDETWRGSWAQGLLLLGLSILSWLLAGGAYYLFVTSLTPLRAGSLAPLIGVNALSTLAGFLVVFAPAGLGVRESTMTVLLAPFVPAGVGAVIALLARLWAVLADIIGAIPAILSLRRRPRAGGRATGDSA